MFEGLCYHGNKSTILLFNSVFRTTPEVSTKLYFVEISEVSEKLWLFNHKRADFLASKFWIFFHFSASLSYPYRTFGINAFTDFSISNHIKLSYRNEIRLVINLNVWTKDQYASKHFPALTTFACFVSFKSSHSSSFREHFLILY